MSPKAWVDLVVRPGEGDLADAVDRAGHDRGDEELRVQLALSVGEDQDGCPYQRGEAVAPAVAGPGVYVAGRARDGEVLDEQGCHGPPDERQDNREQSDESPARVVIELFGGTHG